MSEFWNTYIHTGYADLQFVASYKRKKSSKYLFYDQMLFVNQNKMNVSMFYYKKHTFLHWFVARLKKMDCGRIKLAFY